jgi:parvulin-like peptidyl-prolyl isomerase
MRAFSLFYGALVAKAGCVSVALLLAFAGCGPQDENPTVAEVGDRAITAQDVQAFIDRLPENAGGEGAGKEQLRDHLQTIIDFELMLMEARSQGIERSSAYLTRMDRIRKSKLVGEYERRFIDTTLQEGEVEEYIERENLARAIKLADILVADLETAEQAVREIESGASFADVARKLSMNEQTAARGGDTGRFRTRDQLFPSLAEELFGLEVGSVSDPVRIGNRYAVFKILDDTTAQLNRGQLTKIAENLQREKYRVAKAELVAELTDQYSLEPVPDGIAAFVEALRAGGGDLGHDPSAIVLFRYDGGEVTAADLIVAARGPKGTVLESLRDPEQVVSFAEENIIPDKMIQEAAVRLGIDREEAVVQLLEQQGKQTLAEALRSSVLRERVNITEDDLRQYYEANAERFLHPEQTEVQEILVGTEAEALRLKAMIEDGGSFGELANKHSIRSLEVRDDEGRFHVHRHESPQFGGFVEAAVEAEIGALTGPVEVQEGYSIFKVLSRERKRETFDEAEFRVKSQLRRKTHRDAFNEYMEELRRRYESEVAIHEDWLESADT